MRHEHTEHHTQTAPRPETPERRWWRRTHFSAWIAAMMVVIGILAIGVPLLAMADQPEWLLAPIVPAAMIALLASGLIWLGFYVASRPPLEHRGDRAERTARPEADHG